MKSIILSIFIFVIFSCAKERNPPNAQCTVYPQLGDTTTLFEIDATESTNNQGFSSGLVFRWDFEDDGKWDTDWSTEGSIGHRFKNPGRYQVVVEVADDMQFSDTTSVEINAFGRNKDVSTLEDPRDGRVYNIAKFRGYWWMRENLEYGKVLNPLDLQSDNGIIEQFYGVNPGSMDTIFGLYDWREAMNYNYFDQQGICPPGWHIPSLSEWRILLDGFPMDYALKFYGKDGLSQLDLFKAVCLFGFRGPDPAISFLEDKGGFWASDYNRVNSNSIFIGESVWNYIAQRSLIEVNSFELHELFYNPDLVDLLTIRCIKKVQ